MTTMVRECRWRKSGRSLAFSVSFTKRADGQFRDIYKSVNPATRRNLDVALDRLQEDPYPRQNPGSGQDVIRRLQFVSNPDSGEWRIRVGNYRMVYSIDGDRVTITRVAHRSAVYEGV